MTLRYVLSSFSLYIFYVNYLGNKLKFNLQPWPFDEAESQPLFGYWWSRIMHVTPMCLIASPSDRYDNIYSHVAYLVILTSVKNLQVTWQPYETNEVQGMALNVICRHEQDLWMIVLLLICYYIVEWHLPICVVHQFGGL
jgi:hypothetical protein